VSVCASFLAGLLHFLPMFLRGYHGYVAVYVFINFLSVCGGQSEDVTADSVGELTLETGKT